jgi:hypothetical protein
MSRCVSTKIKTLPGTVRVEVTINLLARSVTPLMASTPFMIKFSKLAAIELGRLGSADRQRPSRFEAHTNV